MTIAEVSRQYDISADTLRYYERIGLLPLHVGLHVRRHPQLFRRMTASWVEYISMRSAGVSGRHCWNM